MYQKGIQVLSKDAEKHQLTNNVDMLTLCQRQMASGHASIAETYMTEPLCDEPTAEQTCVDNLKQALTLQSDNLDALQTMA